MVGIDTEEIVNKAISLADADGVAGLSMRKLAKELGVKAMSLYHYLKNKEQLLDAMVDAVFAQMELPQSCDWQTALTIHGKSMHALLIRHPWSISLLDSRLSPGMATLTRHNWLLGILFDAGFCTKGAGAAIATFDAFVFGFAVQQNALPFDDDESAKQVAKEMSQQMPADLFPHLARLTNEVVLSSDYSFGEEFAPGLTLILDGLERRRETPAG